jgi:polar amino acid transport system substrate-binding protein
VRSEQANLPFTNLKAFVEAGHKVGVVNEYYYGDEVAALYADETLRTKFIGAIISELNMARLLDEEIDGLLEDSFVGASILRRKGLDKYIQPHSISLVPSDVYVMFSKQSVSEQQVEQFNAGLEQLRNNGSYSKIMDKYSH